MTENDQINTGPSQEDLQLLDWQIAMGANEAIGEEAIDWTTLPHPLKDSARKISPDLMTKQAGNANKTVKPVSAARPVDATQDLIGDARKLAASCASLDELTTALTKFQGCPLSRTASNLCFTDGKQDAETLFVGEAPGRDEDLQGKPFVGRSGQLLDKMAAHIGLSRHNDEPAKSVLIANTVFWRPPGNRKPSEAEMLMCLPFLYRLIEITKPKTIVCFGGTPTQRLTGQTQGIMRLRGRWFDFQSTYGNIPLLATLHPSYLLRQPAQKALAWRDMLGLKQRLDEIS